MECERTGGEGEEVGVASHANVQISIKLGFEVSFDFAFGLVLCVNVVLSFDLVAGFNGSDDDAKEFIVDLAVEIDFEVEATLDETDGLVALLMVDFSLRTIFDDVPFLILFD
jgi:hypothetical protein